MIFSHKLWQLHSPELHNLAYQRYLRNTKYRYWYGITESLCHFQLIGTYDWPQIYDPHLHPRFQDAEGKPRVLNAFTSPMLEINILAKALWEFDRSLRVFIRCALLHRQAEPHSDQKNFWVQTPALRGSTCAALQNFILYRNGITAFVDTSPDRYRQQLNIDLDDPQAVFKLRMNLLESSTDAPCYWNQEHSLLSVWKWIFGCHTGRTPEEAVVEMRENLELTNPVIHDQSHAGNGYGIAHMGPIQQWDNSPRICPAEGNDVGGIWLRSPYGSPVPPPTPPPNPSDLPPWPY